MWLKWLPWKYIVRRAAKAHGFIDPISILMRLEQFAQPSEVAEPIELLRAGAVFHARGLINTRAIQHNLDWVWPYWVTRQFDPLDHSFLPRAYSLTHINLTHRNWTAVGLPNCQALPIVDPRGLVTPFFDGWSIDACIVCEDGTFLQPSRLKDAVQHLDMAQDGLSLVTEMRENGLNLQCIASVEMTQLGPVCHVRFCANADRPAYLAIALRPYNPEGISFLHDVALREDRLGCVVNERNCLTFDVPAERFVGSDYHDGDVFQWILEHPDITAIKCKLGLVTAAAMFRIPDGESRTITASVVLSKDEESLPLYASGVSPESWTRAMENVCQLQIPDRRLQFLYDAALRTLILHSPSEVYPGPYTYKRFWFRDAAFILHALLCVGLAKRVERSLDSFPSKQTVTGFFHSQDGEWDSNGEALWIMRRFRELTGSAPKSAWQQSIIKAAHWIMGKRLSDKIEALHAGLMPAGFSAEHLGTNDHYYWDDFWSVAGLLAAASMAEEWGDRSAPAVFRREADALMQAIERSLERSSYRRKGKGLPASPYRRMDSGAVGSLAVAYPLQLWPDEDPRVVDTVNRLMQISFVKGAFFQNMIHSGLNAYLTLHIAQVLLRAGDSRFFDLVKAVARIASPTGQWPEAVHPHTGGGCMGDGQHSWAAAEWVLMIRNMFVREEGNRLILASGIAGELLDHHEVLEFGPAPTPWGPVRVTVDARGEEVVVAWQGEWRVDAPRVEVRLPGTDPVIVNGPEVDRAVVKRQKSDPSSGKRDSP